MTPRNWHGASLGPVGFGCLCWMGWRCSYKFAQTTGDPRGVRAELWSKRLQQQPAKRYVTVAGAGWNGCLTAPEHRPCLT